MVDRLSQGFDRLKRLMPARAFPVVAQLALVPTRPLGHQPPSPRRQFAGDDGEALDVDRGLVVAVGGVEVRPPPVVDLVVIAGVVPGASLTVGSFGLTIPTERAEVSEKERPRT
jgi:hypothetical protein